MSLFLKFDLDETTGCWNWKGACRRGYGDVNIRNVKRESAHRIVLRLSKPCPRDGLLALHHCDNKSCVNPAHLYWGTCKENSTDAVNRKRFPNLKKTHCPQGHPYGGENLYICFRGNGATGRNCKQCRRLAVMQHRARKAQLA